MATIQAFLTELLDNAIEIGPKFVDVALQDPLSAVLVVFGALFVGASVAAFGGLTVGAVVDLLTPSGSGRSPPPEAR